MFSCEIREIFKTTLWTVNSRWLLLTCLKLDSPRGDELHCPILLPAMNLVGDIKDSSSNLHLRRWVVRWITKAFDIHDLKLGSHSGNGKMWPNLIALDSSAKYFHRLPQAVVQRCSVKKGVLTNFVKFTGKHLYQSLFFNKTAGL